MMWTLSKAAVFIATIDNICDRWGYLPCLYGSVLKIGVSANDIDIQMVPKRDMDCHVELINELCNKFNLRQLGDAYLGILNTYSVLLEDQEKKRYDIVVRKNNPNFRNT